MIYRFIVGVCLVLLISVPADAQRRRGGGGGGGNLPQGMQAQGNPQIRRDKMLALQALPVAAIWAELTLGMKVDPEKVELVRVIVKETYKERKSILKDAWKEETWSFTKAQLQKMERELWPKINNILSRRESRQLERSLRRR